MMWPIFSFYNLFINSENSKESDTFACRFHKPLICRLIDINNSVKIIHKQLFKNVFYFLISLKNCVPLTLCLIGYEDICKTKVHVDYIRCWEIFSHRQGTT